MSRLRIVVTGVVQGVGFRPFVYNLATKMRGHGYVMNTTRGVVIEFEGVEPQRFVESIKSDCPPLARIHDVTVEELPPHGYEGFAIVESTDEGSFTHVSPDTSVCPDCLSEMLDPADRRYLYPFINCTNCGPRYTITTKVPYDRPNTTMSVFSMCAACSTEYHDPSSRRFHAQPNACAVCGPRVTLASSDRAFEVPDSADPVEGTIALMERGAIVAIKGLGGFHLCCNARDEEAVRLLRDRKQRRNKPFALMAPDISAVKEFCEVSADEEAMLEGNRRPIVLLRKKRPFRLPEEISPMNSHLGFMLPYTPLHHLLFKYPVTGSGKDRSRLSVLVMTSGNLSEEPIVIENNEAMKRLSKVADAFLLHDRGIFMRVDDSVIAFPDAGSDTAAESKRRAPSFVRRSRGFVPEALLLSDTGPEVLGCGADIKNTFTITKEDCAIVSQHIGDMENFETVSFFEETLANLKHVYRCRPVALAHDLHPDYLTTHWAVRHVRETGLRSYAVQHHHAHVASVMAEHGLRGPLIGVALDGTGYGIDGNLWGSEFIVCDLIGFSRMAHFRYVPLPGGERAIKEGWRTAVSLLADAVSEPYDGDSSGCSECGRKLWEVLESIGFVEKYGRLVLENLLKVRGNRQFSPRSCGAGRLFDGVSAIAGVCNNNTFEGEAAIALESIIDGGDDRSYPFEIQGEEMMEVDFSPMLREVVKEVVAGSATSLISVRFHNTMVDAVDRVVRAIRAKTGVSAVGLSGGVFQNAYLLREIRTRLSAGGFHVYIHEKVPCNDACISLGQAVIVREKLKV